MDILWLILIVASILTAALAFVWVAWTLNSGGGKSKGKTDFIKDAEREVEHIFDDAFREELRNRGRLHFENIINENAMFLKQDLQLTASQLNEFMQDQIKKVLKEEFAKYEESIASAKEIAITSIKKTQEAIEAQRQVLEQQLTKQVAEEKERIIAKFEADMGEIVNHYILEAIGNEIDLTDQLDYIFQNLEDSKQAIIEDIKSGA